MITRRRYGIEAVPENAKVRLYNPNIPYEEGKLNLRKYVMDIVGEQTSGEKLSLKNYTVTAQSGTVPVPKYYTRKWKKKHPRTFKEFKQLCDLGVIVMNDYDVGRIRAEAHTSLTVLSQIKVGGVSLTDLRYLENQGFPTEYLKFWVSGSAATGGSMSGMKFLTGSEIPFFPLEGSIPLYKETLDTTVSSLDLAEVEALFQKPPRDPILIQKVLADANDGEFDVLTQMFETSETIDSIINGLKLMKKGAIAALKREMQLTSRAKAKVRAKATKEFWRNAKFPSRKKFIARGGEPGDYEAFKRIFYERSKADLIAYQEKRVANLTKAESSELADAVAGVWLNYRYNIMPIVYALQDIDRYQRAFGVSYRTYRAQVESTTSVTDILGPDYKSTSFVKVTTNVTIKRQYQLTQGFMNSVVQGLGLDIFVTMLERVPLWGIIVDWFVTASDFLRALSWNPKYSQQVCCYSQKIEFHGTIFDKPGNTISVDGDTFNRVIIDPIDSLGIHWNISISHKRALDALAFAWGKNKPSYLVR